MGKQVYLSDDDLDVIVVSLDAHQRELNNLINEARVLKLDNEPVAKEAKQLTMKIAFVLSKLDGR